MYQSQFGKPTGSKTASIATVLALVLAVRCSPLVCAQVPQGPAVALIRTLAPVKLQGYGTLSGKYQQINDDTAQLTIQAESVAKARMVHAKFLSDLMHLPGVSTGTMQIDRHHIETREAQGQGMVVALREGARVRIFTAPDPERLAMQLRAARMAPGAISRAEVPVPLSKNTTASISENIVSEGRLRSKDRFVNLRSTVSNNGLYDIWTLRNLSPQTTQKVAIEFTVGHRPPFVIDARDGKHNELSGPIEVALKPREVRVFLTPRRQLAQAPLHWFKLLRQQ